MFRSIARTLTSSKPLVRTNFVRTATLLRYHPRISFATQPRNEQNTDVKVESKIVKCEKLDAKEDETPKKKHFVFRVFDTAITIVVWYVILVVGLNVYMALPEWAQCVLFIAFLWQVLCIFVP